MRGLGNIDIQVLDGTNVAANTYNRQMAKNMRLRAMQLNAAKRNAVKYHTGGLNNQTYKNIDAIVNGLDFIGYVGNGSIEDSEMMRAHIVRTKNVVDSAPQAFVSYQNPRELSGMLGYVIDNWDSANREAAIDNMAREERKLIAIGAINIGKDSDAHYLTNNEIYDADRQNVLPNGMVETKIGYRGLFNRLQAAGTNANVLTKDAEIANDHTFTRKAVDTLRSAVKQARTDRPKMLKKTRIKNGYVHTSVVKLPQQTATTADTAKVLRRAGLAERKLADQITTKAGKLNGLGEIESDTLTDILYGTDFAFNGGDGLSQKDNIENYRLYFRRLADAIEENPLLYYNSQAEADAARHILDEVQWAIGSDAAMNELIAKYSSLSGFEGLGKLKILKKVANAVKKTAKAVAKTTANATKAVAKATTTAAKTVAKTTATAAKSVAKTATTATKAAVNTTKAAVKSTVNATKAATNVAKAAVQAATGNKDKAKETLKKAGQQAKAAVTQPAKSVVKAVASTVKTTADVVKDAAKTTKAVVKDNAKATKTLVKDAIVEPTKTVVKQTIINPIKTTIKITKKVTKVIGPVVKKVIKAILLYNPITLLIKAGLLIAFRLNMFKMSSRAYAGSFNETQWAEFAAKNGIELSEFDKFKKAYDKIHHICCDIFGMKESKVLAALEKGSKRKWAGLDAADCSEENQDAFAQAAKEEGEAADKNPELQNDINEVAAEHAAEEAELQQQATATNQELRPDANLPEDTPTQETTVEETVTVNAVTNARTIKVGTPLLETADASGKQIAMLQQGDTVYIDETQGDDKFVAAATIDDKQGFVAKANLATIADGEGVAVSGICGLIDNGYEPIGGLGEAVTAAAATTAASGTIATICVTIGKIFNGGINLINNAADAVETYADIKQAFSNNDNIEETAENIQALSPEQQYMAAEQQQMSALQIAQQKIAQKKAGSNTGLYIGIGVAAAAAIAGFFILKD